MNSEDTKIKILTEDITLLESYIEDLFSFTPLPLCFISPKGMVLEVNPAFMRLTGYDEYEVVGENIIIFLGEKESDSILEKALHGEDIDSYEVIIKKKNGEDILVVAFAKLRKMKDESISGVFFSFYDISEMKKKEEVIINTNKKLEEKIEQLEKISRLTIGREGRMVELKEELEKLKKQIKGYKKGGKEDEE